MLKNYFRVALRNLRRHKLFSIINMLGLAIGISASLVIFLVVQYEYSFDRFEKDGDRMYRVVSDFTSNGGATGHTRGTPAPLAEAVRKEVAGIDQTVSFRYYDVGKIAVPTQEKTKPAVFKSQDNVIFADERYFDLLAYHWLAGSPAALAKPGQVILSATRAKQYFPTTPYADLLGRTIVYDDSIPTQVAAIVQDLDKQGHTDFTFKEFISLATLLDNAGLRNNFHWDGLGANGHQQLYVRLDKGTAPAAVHAALQRIADRQFGEAEKKNNFTVEYNLQPLHDLHFNSDYGNFTSDVASKPTLYGLMLIASFLLLLGSINFINLTTAQAVQRAKEIGIRKTMGGSRRQLIFQFLSETFLITTLAMILSLILTPLLLRLFADFIPTDLHFSLTLPSLWVFLVLLVLAVSLLAGFYPALVLSSYNALLVLKNQAYAGTGKTRRAWVRQSLTVAQFVIALFFVMGMLLVTKQIRFMKDEDLGFSNDAVLSFGTPNSDTSITHQRYVLAEIEKIPGVAMASLSSDLPSSGIWWTNLFEYKDGKKDVKTGVELKSVDAGYLRLFHIPLLAGRELLPSDTPREVLINETYLHELGFKQPAEALGKMVDWNLDKGVKLSPIVGVVKDFHAHPLNYKIAPMIFCQQAEYNHTLIVALRPVAAGDGTGSAWKAAIARIEKVFKTAWPEEDFGYAFLDESLSDAYSNEQHISRLLAWATGLTIFISCLGLLGLVVYITNQRTKEIGVRKVLGATVAQIVTMLSKDFVRLVALAFVIATPLAFWAIHRWLEDYAFRTTISWWVFAVSGLGMIALALFTLSIQTIRTAMANPVEALRSE
jgi:putative ABC transport system permease protein